MASLPGDHVVWLENQTHTEHKATVADHEGLGDLLYPHQEIRGKETAKAILIMPEIIPPTDFTETEKALVLCYLEDVTRPGQDWPGLVRTFNRLREAIVLVSGKGRRTFASLYTHLIDSHLTDPFVTALYSLDDWQGSITLWAAGARQVELLLEMAGLYAADDPPTRLLLAYCLYWWHATAKGYTFEVEIFHDLRQSGMSFMAHDLRLRSERFMPYDLVVSEFRGDVKTSTYFLSLTSGELGNDFYITRLWLSEARSRTLVVFLKPLMWDEIDGETLLVAWRELESCLPQPVRIAHRGGELVVSDYGVWKEKMRAYQARKEMRDERTKDN
jgi:hypothetical protein